MSLADGLLCNGHLTEQRQLEISQIEAFIVPALYLVQVLFEDESVDFGAIKADLLHILQLLLHLSNEVLVDGEMSVCTLEKVKFVLSDENI